MTDPEIRRKILEILKGHFDKNPHEGMPVQEIQTALADVIYTRVEPNLRYLFEAKYIDGRIERYFGQAPFFSDVKISSKGIELIEDPNEFNRKFPTIQVQINITVEKLLAQVTEAITQDKNIPPEQKEDMIESVQKFLSDPLIAPIVGYSVLKILGLA